MPPVRLFPVLILVYLALEIACLIAVGGEIGVLATLALVFGTAVLGSILLRVQGFGILRRIQMEMDAGRVPSREMAHGVMIMLAGLLLMAPGFITDLVGLLLFIPGLRDAGWSLIRRRIRLFTWSRRGHGRHAGERQPTIDLDNDDYTRSDHTRLPPERG